MTGAHKAAVACQTVVSIMLAYNVLVNRFPSCVDKHGKPDKEAKAMAVRDI